MKSRGFATKISYEGAQTILNYCSERCDMEAFEGTLLDSYVIRTGKQVGFNQWKPREYTLVVETYKNCWESEYTLVLTNKEETVLKYFPSLEIF